MKQKLKLLLADDHALFREGLRFLLSGLEIISEIQEVENGSQLLKTMTVFNPDIILMDIEMPVMNGIEATIEVLKLYPETKIIVLSMYADENYYSEMIEAGAKGFLLKNSKFEEVKQAINSVYEGKTYFSQEILDAIIKNLSKPKSRNINKNLTEREIEILYNICKGLSNQEIADILFISKRTVDKHREHILLKSNSKNTAELVVYAIKNNIFEV